MGWSCAWLGRAGLIVSDIEAAHDELIGPGIEASEVWHGAPFRSQARLKGLDPKRAKLRIVLLLRRQRPLEAQMPRPDERGYATRLFG